MAVKDLQSSRKNTVPMSSKDHYQKLADKSKKRLRKNYGNLKSDLEKMRNTIKN